MDHFPIFRLPLELRLEVYEYAMTPEKSDHRIYSGPRYLKEEWDMKAIGYVWIDPSPQRPYLALPKTCSQIRRESMPIFYMVNQFYLLLIPPYPPPSHSPLEDDTASFTGTDEEYAEVLTHTLREFVAAVRLYPPTLNSRTVSITVELTHAPWTIGTFSIDRKASITRMILAHLDELRRSNLHFEITFALTLSVEDQGLPFDNERVLVLTRASAKLDEDFRLLQRAINDKIAAVTRRSFSMDDYLPFFEWCEGVGFEHVRVEGI